MSESLARKVGNIGQDNLIAGLFPPTSPFGTKIAAGQGELKRGTVLDMAEDGTCTMLASGGKANCVLADDVDASGDEPVTAVAYRTGHLNSKALIVTDGYELTNADKEELRKGGILLSEMID